MAGAGRESRRRCWIGNPGELKMLFRNEVEMSTSLMDDVRISGRRGLEKVVRKYGVSLGVS